MTIRRRVARMLVSIRTRLAVFFFLITLLAIAVVYVGVAPSLQSSLAQQNLKNLDLTANSDLSTRLKSEIASAAIGSKKATADLESLRSHTGADVVTVVEFTTASNGGLKAQFKFTYPNQPANPTAVESYSVAAANAAGKAAALAAQRARAAKHGKHAAKAPAAQTVTPPESTAFGLVAVPFAYHGQEYVFVFSANTSDVHGDVLLIRRRILIAAAIALALVLLLGVLVARALTVRVLRLERAAQRVAQGDFSTQFEVDSHDELGQLAAALAHMQSQLQELENARRRFIAVASHELRTPIFSLGGFLELIQDEELDEETRRQFVGQVREQVARLGKLATGLLDLSRLEAGSVDLEPTPTDLGVLSRAVASEFVPALTLHDSELKLRLPEQPLRVACDPDRVAQLLRILIDNAITHTPAGTAVTIRVAPANGNHAVRLSVSDSGPGIAPEAIGRIFEPFYSADGVQGAGLGLAIARELADRMHGGLEVRSRDGSTVFTLTLPGEEGER
jgi:signal transduction histidine kinase